MKMKTQLNEISEMAFKFDKYVAKTFTNQNITWTRRSMIGSPERVKIQRSLVQNFSKIQQRLKIIGGFLKFWGLKYPQGVRTTFWGQNNFKNEFSTVEIQKWAEF